MKTNIFIHGYDVELDVYSTIENDGIGSYEYWGSNGFDIGRDYAVIEEITVLSIEKAGDCKDRTKESFQRLFDIYGYNEKNPINKQLSKLAYEHFEDTQEYSL